MSRCDTSKALKLRWSIALFLEKSGRRTYGLDWFYNGKTQRAEKGLELSVVAIVDVEQNMGYTLLAQQTEAALSDSAKPMGNSTAALGDRLEFYLGHLAYCIRYFPTWIRDVVADGFYSQYKWVTGVVQLGFHAIGKRRCDADLKFLYDGPDQGQGARRKHDGKVNLKDHRWFQVVQRLEDGFTGQCQFAGTELSQDHLAGDANGNAISQLFDRLLEATGSQ